MSTAQEVFERSIRPLPVREQIRIAELILNELARADVRIVDEGDEWTEEDRQDLTTFVLRYADNQYPEDVELV